MEKSNLYTITVLETKNFLMGQLSLYKIRYSETDNNGYLSVMNSFNNALDTIQRMSRVIDRLIKENKKLKEQLKQKI